MASHPASLSDPRDFDPYASFASILERPKEIAPLRRRSVFWNCKLNHSSLYRCRVGVKIRPRLIVRRRIHVLLQSPVNLLRVPDVTNTRRVQRLVADDRPRYVVKLYGFGNGKPKSSRHMIDMPPI